MANLTIQVNTLPLRAKVEGITGLIKETLWLNRVGDVHAEWMRNNIQRKGQDQRRWPLMARNTRIARPSRSSRRHFSRAFEQRLLTGTFKRIRGKQVEVGINAEHAELHHGGAPAHIIRPRRAKFLRFETTRGTVFAKRVEHPGIEPRPMLPTKNLARKLSLEAISVFLKEIRKRGNK